jgi:hypothetical protein
MFVGLRLGIRGSVAGSRTISSPLTIKGTFAVTSPTTTFSFTSENTLLAVTAPFVLPPVMMAVPPTKPLGRPGRESFRLASGTPSLVGVSALPSGTLTVIPMTVIVLAVIASIGPSMTRSGLATWARTGEGAATWLARAPIAVPRRSRCSMVFPPGCEAVRRGCRTRLAQPKAQGDSSVGGRAPVAGAARAVRARC